MAGCDVSKLKDREVDTLFRCRKKLGRGQSRDNLGRRKVRQEDQGIRILLFLGSMQLESLAF